MNFYNKVHEITYFLIIPHVCTALWQYCLSTTESDISWPAAAPHFRWPVEHSHGLWHQAAGPLGANHPCLQVQPGRPIFWNARSHHGHSALWVSDGETAGGQALGVVYRDNWSRQGRNLCATGGSVQNLEQSGLRILGTRYNIISQACSPAEYIPALEITPEFANFWINPGVAFI